MKRQQNSIAERRKQQWKVNLSLDIFFGYIIMYYDDVDDRDVMWRESKTMREENSSWFSLYWARGRRRMENVVYEKKSGGSQSARNIQQTSLICARRAIRNNTIECSIYTSIVKLIFETPSVSAQFSQQSRLPLKSHTSSRASVSLYQLSFLCDSSLFTPNLILITEKWLVCRNKKSFIMEFSPFLAALR